MQLIDVFTLLNSNLIVELVTLAVGLIAYYIYDKGKKDRKRDAANIILLEIRNAERQLKLAKESLNQQIPILSENIFVMQTESWSRYRYLFVRDFDRDEWDTITDFYNKCLLYDQSVSYNNSFFQKNEEQIRVNIQRVLADYAKKFSEKVLKASNPQDIKKLDQELVENTESFRNKYMDLRVMYLYNPQKPVNDVKNYIDNLDVNLSLTTIGTKLKKLAGVKD